MDSENHVKEDSSRGFPVWKSIAGITVGLVSVRLLRHWVSEATAWAVGSFAMVLLIQLLPPRSNLSLVKVILLGAGTAVFMYLITRLIG